MRYIYIGIATGLLPLVDTRFADALSHARSAIESAQVTAVLWGSSRAEGQA
jgi:hypothetical protein